MWETAEEEPSSSLTVLYAISSECGCTFAEESGSNESHQSFLRCMGVVWCTLCLLSWAFIVCGGSMGGRMVVACCWHPL